MQESRRTDTPLRVVVGCDTDPDRLDFGGTAFNAGSEPQIWRGVACIPELRDRLDAVVDSRGCPVRVTWLLRCDEQIRVTEGAYEASIVERKDIWKHCELAGDEIGWHPHFWRLEPDGRTWFHEVDDLEFQGRMLRESHAAFSSAWGKPPMSVRMGWDYHNATTMTEISKLGIRIDFSALPYQYFPGARNDRGASFAGLFDWRRTGTLPYHPSREDYQARGEGTSALDIVELPLGLLRSRLVGLLSEARGALRDRSPRRVLSSLRPGGAVAHSTIKACAPTPLFRAMVKDTLNRGEDWLATYFHPDELLPSKGQLVNDLIHKPSYFVKNMEAVVRIAGRRGREVHFLTASEAADTLSP